MTRRQKAVVFEGPNLRYPELGDDTAVFHTSQLCLRDARGYGEVWARVVPGRVPKFPGCVAIEEYLRLLEVIEDSTEVIEGAPVVVHLVGGEYDGASMGCVMPQAWELYYIEPVPQPRRGTWYVHAADCSCGVDGRGPIVAGHHKYRPKVEAER